MNTAKDIIRERRLELRMSQEQLAGAAGVTRKTVMRAEAGSRISTETLKALCAVLDFDSTSFETDSGTETVEGERPSIEKLIEKSGLPADARDLALGFADCIAEVAPNARSVAVTDAAIWRRLTYKQMFDVDDPGDANPAKDADRRQLYEAASAAMLVACLGQPIFLMLTVMIAKVDILGGADALDWYFSLFPSVMKQPLAAMLAMCFFVGLPTLGGAFGFAYYSGRARSLRISEDINTGYAKVIEASAEGFKRRVYVAGPEGLHILDARDDGSVDSVHIEPWMVASCQIEGGTFRPSLLMHQSSDRNYRDDEPREVWIPKLYRHDVKQFRLPYLVPGEEFIEAMASFRPVARKDPNKTVTHRSEMATVATPVLA